MSDNIKLPIVKNIEGKFIHIKTINEYNRNLEYFCPCCGSIAKPRSIKIDNSYTAHFYHLDNTKCKQESIYHFVYKNWMFEPNKSISIILENKEINYLCEKLEIEEKHETNVGLYIPDLTIYTTCGKSIFVEINYSNSKKSDDYFLKWKELGNVVVEVNVKNLFNYDYSTEDLKLCAIFDGEQCVEKYKESMKQDMYYVNIHKYKQYQTCDEERLKQLEKLDWFYIDMCKYVKNSITKEDLLETFKCMEYQDMEICHNMIKNKTCCKELKAAFISIINDEFKNYINNLSKGIYVNNFECNLEYKEQSKNIIEIIFKIKYLNENIELKRTSILASIRHYGILKYSLFSDIINDKLNEYISYFKHVNSVIELYYKYDNKEITYHTFNKIINSNEIDSIKYLNICVRGESYDIIEMIHRDYNRKKQELFFDILKNYVRSKYDECIALENDNCFNKTKIQVDINFKNSLYKFFSNEQNFSLNISKDDKSAYIKSKIDTLVNDVRAYRDKIITKYNTIKDRIEFICNENTEIICNYNMSKTLFDDINPVIWIKDYDNVETVYYCKVFHKDIYKRSNQYNFVNIDDLLSGGNFDMLYIHEGYRLSKYPANISTVYDYINPFKNQSINLSFKSGINSNYDAYLHDFDFVRVTNCLSDIFYEIRRFEYSQKENNKDIIPKIFEKKVTSNNINNSIINLLEQIIEIVENSKSNEVNIALNIKYTNVNGNGYEPWRIKEFIDALSNISISNFKNNKRIGG